MFFVKNGEFKTQVTSSGLAYRRVASSTDRWPLPAVQDGHDCDTILAIRSLQLESYLFKYSHHNYGREVI